MHVTGRRDNRNEYREPARAVGTAKASADTGDAEMVKGVANDTPDDGDTDRTRGREEDEEDDDDEDEEDEDEDDKGEDEVNGEDEEDREVEVAAAPVEDECTELICALADEAIADDE